VKQSIIKSHAKDVFINIEMYRKEIKNIFDNQRLVNYSLQVKIDNTADDETTTDMYNFHVMLPVPLIVILY